MERKNDGALEGRNEQDERGKSEKDEEMGKENKANVEGEKKRLEKETTRPMKSRKELDLLCPSRRTSVVLHEDGRCRKGEA